jgi:hypothetical protein
VTRLQIQGLQDQDVQRAFQEFRPSCHCASR